MHSRIFDQDLRSRPVDRAGHSIDARLKAIMLWFNKTRLI